MKVNQIKKEIAAKITSTIKLYHNGYHSGGGWETLLLARWVG